MLKRHRLPITPTSFLVYIFIGLSFLLSANLSLAQSRAASYKVITTVDIEAELNKHGKEGWRFKSIMPWECKDVPVPGKLPSTYPCALLVLEK